MSDPIKMFNPKTGKAEYTPEMKQRIDDVKNKNKTNEEKLELYELKKQVSIYLKGDKIVDNIKSNFRIDQKGLDIFTKRGQAETFYDANPYYYDDAGIFWLWNHDEKKYEMKDEVGLLNSIHKELNADTISGKNKSEIVNALRQVGRDHKPEVVPKQWIQFKTKIVDIKNDLIFDADPKYFVTNPIPWDIGESEDTPMMDKYFKEWVSKEGIQDESYAQTLYEVIAYASSTDQFLQRLVALCGLGRNGKGTFLKILMKFLGDNNVCTSELKILTNNIFESASLYKKLLCVMGEVDSEDMQNTTLLKSLSGEDKIRYGFKGKTAFSDTSPTTCIMATNSLPISKDNSDGFYRRWLIIDFPNIFEVGKDVLADIPEIEYNNLARKIIRILKNLYNTPKFTNEGSISERMKKYDERSNPLLRFIENECVESPEAYMTLHEFSKQVNVYLKHHRLRPMSVREVGNGLRKEAYAVKDKHVELMSGEHHSVCVFGLKINIKSNISDKQEVLDG